MAVELAARAEKLSGRVRVLVDGPPPTDPDGLGAAVTEELRVRGRTALAVRAADFLRPASLRLEYGHHDEDMFLDGWLDVGALLREVLGDGPVLPRLWDAERDRALAAGHDLDRVLLTDDLVTSDDAFFAATGITDGYLLEGVRYWSDGATTYSMVMRSRSGTIRYVKSDHRFEKLERFSSIDYRP